MSLVGDVHQPLHVSFQDDRGGNNVGVSGSLCSWDLHAVGDRCIIEHGCRATHTRLHGTFLTRSRTRTATWRASRPIDWANESFAITISSALQYCFRTDEGCWYDADKERLDQGQPERMVLVDRAYIETHTPIVRERLVKAAVRLGALLDRALGD